MKKTTKTTPLPSMYDQAVALHAQLAKHQTAMPLHVALVSYSEHVVKVRVDFLRHGAPALSIEYWGNAELDWVEVNVDMNAAHVANAGDKKSAAKRPQPAGYDELLDALFQLAGAVRTVKHLSGYKYLSKVARAALEQHVNVAGKLLERFDRQAVLAKIDVRVEVVKRHGAKTLGGDVDGLATLIAERLHVSASQGRQLLSDACERIEFASDGEGLEKITAEDIVAMARTVLTGE